MGVVSPAIGEMSPQDRELCHQALHGFGGVLAHDYHHLRSIDIRIRM
jgi:hypothetical protein